MNIRNNLTVFYPPLVKGSLVVLGNWQRQNTPDVVYGWKWILAPHGSVANSYEPLIEVVDTAPTDYRRRIFHTGTIGLLLEDVLERKRILNEMHKSYDESFFCYLDLLVNGERVYVSSDMIRPLVVEDLTAEEEKKEERKV